MMLGGVGPRFGSPHRRMLLLVGGGRTMGLASGCALPVHTALCTLLDVCCTLYIAHYALHTLQGAHCAQQCKFHTPETTSCTLTFCILHTTGGGGGGGDEVQCVQRVTVQVQGGGKFRQGRISWGKFRR